MADFSHTLTALGEVPGPVMKGSRETMEQFARQFSMDVVTWVLNEQDEPIAFFWRGVRYLPAPDNAPVWKPDIREVLP